jgi:hypothetical protein
MSEDELKMSEDELKFPEWQGPLQDLILEFDRDSRLEKSQKVEALLLERIRELSVSTGGRMELDALVDALSMLRILNRGSLGSPASK